MKFLITTTIIGLLSCFIEANGPLTSNVVNWSGVTLYDTQENYIMRELNGQTGWSILEGQENGDATYEYQMSVVMT